MKKVVLYAEGGHQEFENFEKMFEELSEKGVIVESVKDGSLVIKGKEVNFAIQTTEGTSEMFMNEVSLYRDELRGYIAKLKKQGIQVSPEEMKKLAKQFEFLPKAVSASAPAAEVSEPEAKK
jgi:hypothetical protein